MDDHFRISDTDRDRVAAVLRQSFAAGRLTAQELDARLAVALSATTAGELGRALADLPAPAPVAPAASGMPRAAIRLERSYRRLLFLYPSRYRRVHEEEMLAVLMTAAPDGQQRPGLAEAADLIWGALRVRLQPQSSGSEPAWRDALAALSVILPVLMLVTFAAQDTGQWLSSGKGIFDSWYPVWLLRQIAAPIALVVLVLLRRRRAAIVGAAALFSWIVLALADTGSNYATAEAYALVPLGLEIVALAASAGPRRGRQLLTWKHGALAATGALAASFPGFHGSPVPLLVVAVAGGAAMTLASPLGRWLTVLLAIAAWPLLIFDAFPYGLSMEPYLPYGAGIVSQTYLLPAALLALFAMSARRESRRPAPLAPAFR
jgi:uncharacterized membrane protein